MMEKMKIPCVFYLYLHSKIFQKQNGNPIRQRDLINYLFEWKIPKKLRPLIIKEMVILGLLKKVRYTYELEKPKIYEENINEYYDKLGMFENGK